MSGHRGPRDARGLGSSSALPPPLPPRSPRLALRGLRRWCEVARSRPRVLLALALLLAGLALLARLQQNAVAVADARKSSAARAFEDDPDDWLRHPTALADFKRALADGRIAAVGLVRQQPGLLLYTATSGDKASTTLPGCGAPDCLGPQLDRLGERSAEAGFALVNLDIDPRPTSQRLIDGTHAAGSPLLLLLVLAAAAWYMPRLQAGIGAASRLTLRPQTRFADVVGSAEAKSALQRVKSFMHDPAKYARLGAVPPRGVLLVGPPGTGKTLLARALAGESQASFIAVDGSYFTAMFYGAGVAKVRELFKLARQHAPCVLFIDEIDGIGRRSQGAQGGPGGAAESELNRIINRVLVEMDGFDALDNVVVVGATNHEDNIDEAMRRPGRFDSVVRLALPTLPDRRGLFEHYLGKVSHDGVADTASLARMSAGMTPADIAGIVNKAASSAAEKGADCVAAADFMRAIETVQLGGEISAIQSLLSPETRRRLAYHEAGHALVGHVLRVGSVERVTIEPRGAALGVTHIHRGSEDPLYAQAELVNRLAMTLAGREAEMLVQGSVSSGASDDLKRASELAVKMVGSLGFSEAFGLLSIEGVPRELLGPDIQAAALREARVLLEQAQATCRGLLVERRGQLDALADGLLAQEVLAGAELEALLA